jgi:hypothetical protein
VKGMGGGSGYCGVGSDGRVVSGGGSGLGSGNFH